MQKCHPLVALSWLMALHVDPALCRPIGLKDGLMRRRWSGRRETGCPRCPQVNPREIQL